MRNCHNLQGNLNVSENRHSLIVLFSKNCAENFVVVISSECPLAQKNTKQQQSAYQNTRSIINSYIIIEQR